MILNDEQNSRFFDTMDALLYYVNDRFRVVESFTLDYSNPLDDVKSSLVARTLWENVEVIDDFVRENPYGLSKSCLETARAWKSALPGFFTLVRYQSGRALLMNEAGVFSVCGITNELEGEIGPAPAYVELVLLPFDNVIVYDGFLQSYDTEGTATELQRIQDEFENRCSKGIALTAADFIRQADAYLAAQRDKEFEKLMADVARESAAGEEQLPPGFHRGVLAGLSAEERETAVMDHLAELSSSMVPSAVKFDQRVRKRKPVTSLRDCLMLFTKAQLEAFAQLLGMRGLARLRKAEMVGEIAAELPLALETLESYLFIATLPCYEMARKLASGDPVTFSADERKSYVLIWPMEPFIFMFRDGTTYTVLVPDELKPLFAQVDFGAVDRIRRMRAQALSCMAACVTLCGVVSVDDAYDQYRGLVSDVLSRDEFYDAINENIAIGNSVFDLWTYMPTDYLVHYSLSPDFVAQEFGRAQHEQYSKLLRDTETGELSDSALRQFAGNVRSSLSAELEQLEQYKRGLVESQSNLPMKPLSRSLLENDVLGELLDDPNAERLRVFLDAHVPDGADDYSFAERVVEEMVQEAMETGSLQGMFACARDWGLEGCSTDEERLPTLITNLYNSLPSWENNGWSPQELYEQVTGRKMFYNEDGSVMRVGADEPCPCGSGKKYRDCCGR